MPICMGLSCLLRRVSWPILRAMLATASLSVIAYALFLHQAALAAQLGASSPVALAIPNGQRGFVLQSNGEVVSFDLRQSGNIVHVFKIHPSDIAADLTAVELENTSLLCLTVMRRVRNQYQAWAVQVSNGRSVWSWLPRSGFYGGVSVDPHAKMFYVVNSDTGEIFRVPFNRNEAHYVGSVPSFGRPGPVALESDSRGLLVGDAQTGDLYRLDLHTRRVTTSDVLVGADIRAVASDRAGEFVYVADSGRETVWRLSRKDKGFAAAVFTKPNAVREPSGLAIDPAGYIWVTDARAKRLVRFGPDGTVAPTGQP
jgi:hypothetical protein